MEEKLRQRLVECRRTGRLNLSYLELTEFPAGLVQQLKTTAPSIQELDLRSNSLASLPAEVAELRTLRSIKLNYNKFTSFPQVLTHLPRVQIIECTGNQITEIDASIRALKSVLELDFSGNRIASIDPALCELDNLVSINLENNLISTLPDDLCMMTSLSRVDLSTNRLSRLPSNLSRLANLTRLDVNSNNLVTIPPEIGRIKSLRELDVRYNELKEPMKSASEESLPKFLEFLRQEEEREKQEELERLKPVGHADGSYTYYALKFKDGDDAHRCQLRQGHTTTHCGTMMILFGGTVSHDGRKDNDVYVLNMDRMVWSKALTQGTPPSPRDGHAAAYDPVKERLYVFGGRDAERRRLNDMHYLDVNSWAWTKVDTVEAGNEPSPREGASMCIGGRHLFVFAGCTKGLRYNDIYVFDIDTETWEVADTSGSAPSPRFNAALCYNDDLNSLFIFGGRNTFMLCDLYALDLDTLVFREIPTVTNTKGSASHPRRVHSCQLAFCKGDLYVMFGVGEMGAVVSGYRMKLTHLEQPSLSSPSAAGAAGSPSPSPLGSTSGRLRQGANTLRGEWFEMNTELNFLPNRIGTFDASTGLLFVLQEGSSVVGVPTDDRQESVDSSRNYSVLAHVSVNELKDNSQSPCEVVKKENMKRGRIERYREALASTAPKSFHTQSLKEKKVLDYVERYRKQFIELYTSRRPMPLTFQNEVGVDKFVCTTIRPTLMPYTELYDWDTAARFLADFLEYEVLEDAQSYPFCLPSPSNVLHWQAGDCFDFAVALASLLLGAGYDCLVAVGYAEEAVTVHDQRNTTCPFVRTSDGEHAGDARRGIVASSGDTGAADKVGGKDAQSGKRVSVAGAAVANIASKYLLPKGVSLESSYLRGLGESKDDRNEEDDALEDGSVPSSPIRRDGEAFGSGERTVPRLHAWVVVLAGKREVVESFFIEPSTGTRYPVRGQSPYNGIECIFNNRNFYINMQDRFVYPEPGFLSLSGISLDLNDSSCWEYVLPKEDLTRAAVDDRSAADAASSSAVGGGGAESALESAPGMPANASGASQTPGVGTTNGDAEATEGEAGDIGSSAEVSQQQDVLDMPASWVPKLSIAREAFDMRCPRGEKITVFRNCTYEIFALFGECSRYSGETSRYCLYEDEHRSTLLECRETFARRKDKLQERKVRPLDQTIVETFGPGSSFGLKDITVVKGVKRVMNFYINARLDGLVSRTEIFGAKTIEEYAGRDDRITYRSVKYLPTPGAPSIGGGTPGGDESSGFRSPTGPRSRSSLGQTEAPPLEIIKITEKFERNHEVDADKDIAKRTFAIQQDQIKLDFHYGSGRISASSRLYAKDGVVNVVQVDPKAQARPSDVTLLEEYQALLVREKECILGARESEREVQEIIRVRAKEEQPPQLEVPYYDVVRATVESSDEEDAEESATIEHDYLSTFLPKEALVSGYKLSKSEALEVREKCLRALHDRLIEREHIIQARHDEETASLAKRQTNFQRDRDQMTPQEEQEYEKACEESMFRIHILEQRIKRHEEQALQKYYDLDSKLCNDPRLSVLLSEQ